VDAPGILNWVLISQLSLDRNSKTSQNGIAQIFCIKINKENHKSLSAILSSLNNLLNSKWWMRRENLEINVMLP
jgi:hypothetical protein